MSAFVTQAAVTPAQHLVIGHDLARVRRGCAHLATAPVVLGCVRHLDTLRCPECADRHTATHSHDEEHRCDVCNGSLHGADGETSHVGMLAPVPFGRSVGLGRGRSALVSTVVLIGWGACFSCHIDMTIEGLS